MMELMVEVVIIAFAVGGIFGAIVALHLSKNLKQTETSREPAPATIELSRNEESTDLNPVPVDIASRRAANGHRHRR